MSRRNKGRWTRGSRDVHTVNEGERVEDRENGKNVEVNLAQRRPRKRGVCLRLDVDVALFHYVGVISIKLSILKRVV